MAAVSSSETRYTLTSLKSRTQETTIWK